MGAGQDTRLGSPLDPTFNISVTASEWRASWSVAATVISMLFGGYTIFVLFRRPWRPTLVFIIILLIADWFKAFWQFTYSVYWLADRPTGLLMDSSWCQAEGFMIAWAIEMSDCTLTAMLSYVAFGVATRLHHSTVLVKSLSILGYFLWFGVPILLAGLAFVNGSGYTNQSTTCYLPIRPFWYRLGLSWIPRYVMLFTSSGAILWLFIYVKAKHRSFIILLRRPDEASSHSHNMPPSTLDLMSPPASMPTSPIYPETVLGGPLGANKPHRSSQVELSIPELRVNSLVETEVKPGNLDSTGTGNSMATDSVSKSTDEVLRRLRRLWVYPLVYFMYWIFPFVYHAMTYKLYFVLHPVPVLAGLSSTFLALQCTLMSIAVWVFERPGRDSAEAARAIPVWRYIRDQWRPSNFFDTREWEKTAEQRQSAIFAKQRLAIEREDYQAQRHRRSALSSMANVRNSILIDNDQGALSHNISPRSSGPKAVDFQDRGSDQV